MIHKDLMLVCLTLLIIMSFSPLFADTNPNPYSCIIDPEFSNTDLVYAPLAAWAAAGSNAIIDTLALREINITDIEPIVCYNNVISETDTTTFVSAIPDDDLDDSGCFNPNNAVDSSQSIFMN